MRARFDPSTRTLLEPGTDPASPRDEAAGPSAFVELFARSTFSGVTLEGAGAIEGASLLDAEDAWPGAGQPEEIVARAALFAQDVVSVVDVDTLSGVVRAFSAGRELGVRVVVGCELLLDEGSLVLHAASAQGYANLCAVLTLAREGLEKDDVDHALLRVCAHAEGLFATVFPPFDEDALGALLAGFQDRLSVGLAFHKVPEDAERLRFARKLERLGVPIVLTARPFLVDKDDKRLHDVLTCIRQHLTVDSAAHRLLPNSEARMRSHAEMLRLCRERLRDLGGDAGEVPAWVARARFIADACTFELGQLQYAFPRHTGAVASDVALLRTQTFAGAAERYPEGVPEDVRVQLEHELELVEAIDVAAYFLTVKDIVDIARSKGILCQGRGSAANSAVCFCLGITSIDPVRMGLLFERFLSRERAEPPDIDVDFEHERREEVIQALYDKYGRDHAVMVSEVIAYRGRSAVREVGKVHGLSESVTARVSDLMLHSSLRELGGAQGIVHAIREAGLDPEDRRILRTMELSLRLQGHPRHLGIHVGGFVLTDAPITTLGPVEPARMDKRTILPWDKDDVEALGLFKMDVLGLGMLTCIRKCFDLIHLTDGVRWTLATLPQEDPETYAALQRADSIGVFQVESRAQMAMLPRLKPQSFYDLVVEVAIIRPGPIQGGMVHPYLRRRNGEEKIDYPHESLRPILERTLGVPLFQEQVMKLAIVGAGYSGGEADQLRRDMAAWKKTGRLERHRQKLLDGFARTGVPAEFAERLYEQIKGFGEYGFPESHAASFAILVYASSWLKTHHPAHFACALINSLPMGFYAPAQIIADAQEHGVSALAVDVNVSGWDCTLEPASGGAHPALRLGLRLIKGLREDTARAIAEERETHGAFVDVNDLVRRCSLDKKARAALAKAGALDSLTPHRRASVWAAMGAPPPLLRALKDDLAGTLPAPSATEVLLLDYESVGVSLTDHPMRHMRAAVQVSAGHRTVLDSRAVKSAQHGTRAFVCGLVIGRQRPGTADGTCFVTLEDEHGMVNVVVWGRDFDRWRKTVVTSTFLLVDGVIEKQGIVIHVIAHGVRAVEPRMTGAQLDLPFASRDFH